jgi:hypothetical protein
MTRVYRSIQEPIRKDPSYDDRWNGPDMGLIICWETGILKSIESPALAERVKNGELPKLGWKGGLEKKVKMKEKFGSLFYLARWQGLRGEDLNIDLSEERAITCSRTKVKVTFTADMDKFKEP